MIRLMDGYDLGDHFLGQSICYEHLKFIIFIIKLLYIL